MLFLLHVSRREFPAQLVQDLARLYPEAAKFCIADGAINPDWQAVCEGYGWELHEGDRLKPWPNAGKWTERWMQLAVGMGAPVIVKLDADCQIKRRFTVPAAPIAGHLACHLLNHQLYLRGGVVAYQRSALVKILQSDLLNDPCYQNPVNYAYYNQGELLSSEDQILGHICGRLGIALAAWPEVHNAWREPLPIGDFAITAGGL